MLYIRSEEFVQSESQLYPEGPWFARTRTKVYIHTYIRKSVRIVAGCPTSVRGLFGATALLLVSAPAGPIVPGTHYRHYHEFQQLLRLCCTATKMAARCILPCNEDALRSAPSPFRSGACAPGMSFHRLRQPTISLENGGFVFSPRFVARFILKRRFIPPSVDVATA